MTMTTDQKVSRQWATRAPDERFTSLIEMRDVAAKRKHESRQQIISTKQLRFETADNDGIVAFVSGEKAGGKFVKAPRVELTNYAFGQVANRIKCPAEFMGRLPNKLAVANLNECAEHSKADKIQLLTRENGTKELRAATSEKYGRIWDADILTHMVEQYGDGITGRFRVPGEFGKAVTVTQNNTTLYMSDRDMFVFLCDEQNRVELPNRRNGEKGSLARGFYFWNSEVGAATFGVSTFYFDYVCCNRIIWGQEEVQQVKMRHSKFAPERFVQDVLPGLTMFTEGASVGITTAIENARKVTFEAPEIVSEMLQKKFPKKVADKIAFMHMLEEEKPIENMYDLTNAMTAYARTVPFQDARVAIEIEAGKILKTFAA